MYTVVMIYAPEGRVYLRVVVNAPRDLIVKACLTRAAELGWTGKPIWYGNELVYDDGQETRTVAWFEVLQEGQEKELS